jgi:hypothetical protein
MNGQRHGAMMAGFSQNRLGAEWLGEVCRAIN